MTTTPQTNASIREIADIIRDGDDFVICGHVSPDGDCLGCQLALAHALWDKGRVDDLIPNDLIEPVAEVLKWVKKLQDAKKEEEELDSITLD